MKYISVNEGRTLDTFQANQIETYTVRIVLLPASLESASWIPRIQTACDGGMFGAPKLRLRPLVAAWKPDVAAPFRVRKDAQAKACDYIDEVKLM
jgi:hypothetical protein